MPRLCRLLSETNVYHIVLKGINSEQIFYDDDDYHTFLKVLKKSSNDYHTQILAFCIMNNHIHLLLKFSENNMAQMFKSFGASFVLRYNNKYLRSGSLFNGRYYSKAVNDDSYLLTVLKYIHFNPVSAGLCNSPAEWKWSSYNEYASDNRIYTDIDFIYSIINKNQFFKLHETTINDVFSFLPIENSINKISDVQLTLIINNMKEHFSDLDIAICLKKSGIPAYKISKLLGISRAYAYKL
ncbi:MAG: transposase [Clostridia bacterium]|nr:transposase [Clostridia bacterium]